jgi:hypothetical protein
MRENVDIFRTAGKAKMKESTCRVMITVVKIGGSL